MKKDIKIILVQHSISLALGAGTLLFIGAFLLTSRYANWPILLAAGFATAAFVLGTAGVYVIANNIADAYALEVSIKGRALYDQISRVRDFVKQVRGRDIAENLNGICAHAADLVARTRKQQPDKLLSVTSGLLDWFQTLLTALDQYVDVQDHPGYHNEPAKKLAQGIQAFASFDKFLVNSIKTLEQGDNLDFEVAAKMLDATRFSIIS